MNLNPSRLALVLVIVLGLQVATIAALVVPHLQSVGNTPPVIVASPEPTPAIDTAASASADQATPSPKVTARPTLKQTVATPSGNMVK